VDQDAHLRRPSEQAGMSTKAGKASKAGKEAKKAKKARRQGDKGEASAPGKDRLRMRV